MDQTHTIKKGIVAVIILAIFLLTFLLVKPILIAIIFGLLFAYIFCPVFKKIKSVVRNGTLSAILLIVAIIILIALPLIYLGPELADQAFESYQSIRSIDFASFYGKYFSESMAVSLSEQTYELMSQLFSVRGQLVDILMDLPYLALQFVVFLFTFFFTIRDHEKLKAYAINLSPFSQSTEKKFLKEFRGITDAIIYGQVFIGVVQGLILGIGLYFLGVPQALTLTFIAAIVSVIPVLGTWLVWLPVGIYLLLSGETFSGFFLLIYGAVLVSSIDNFLRPYILSKRSSLHIVLSVIGTIGGLYLFGIVGLVLGPLILAYVMIIIDFYRQGKLNELFN